MSEISESDMDSIVEKLMEMHATIVAREGEEPNQYEAGGYIFTINLEDNNYEDPEDPETQYLITSVQVEKGPLGMEQLVAAIIEQRDQAEIEDADGYAIVGEMDNVLEELELAYNFAMRHWRWLDAPRHI